MDAALKGRLRDGTDDEGAGGATAGTEVDDDSDDAGTGVAFFPRLACLLTAEADDDDDDDDDGGTYTSVASSESPPETAGVPLAAATDTEAPRNAADEAPLVRRS